MRGKGVTYHTMGRGLGITPAHAGKSLCVSSHVSRTRDHPRTCGEKAYQALGGVVPPGSPPHMRGKGLNYEMIVELFGITPAHAGKRRFATYHWSRSRDHPRTCGEKI